MEGRRLVSLISTMDNHPVMRAAGYHMGETKWIGEQQNIIAIKVESIPKSAHSETLPKIRKALKGELHDAQILFVDEKYLTRLAKINSQAIKLEILHDQPILVFSTPQTEYSQNLYFDIQFKTEFESLNQLQPK